MNFLDAIEKIKLVLFEYGREDLSIKVLDAQLIGGTGGEVLISVCSQLLEIKKREPDVYSLIESNAEELIKYANSLGLYPTSS